MEKGSEVLIKGKLLEERQLKTTKFYLVQLQTREQPIWVTEKDLIKKEGDLNEERNS